MNKWNRPRPLSAAIALSLLLAAGAAQAVSYTCLLSDGVTEFETDGGATANGIYSLACGEEALADANDTVAIGNKATATGSLSV